MKVPFHRRRNPSYRSVGPLPEGVDLDAVAGSVKYVGSSYHKDAKSFAGKIGKHRPDASICPRELGSKRALVDAWLREAVQKGHCSAHWENGFPRYVWRREGETVYEARLVNREKGEYKGYPLEKDQPVRRFP